MMKKVILITGASRGIGAATALAAADAGYHVGINYTRDEGAAQAIAEQVRAKGAMAAVLQADISNEAQVLAMFDAVHTQLGALTALVNNAGIILAQARLQDMDATRIQRMLAVNVFGALVCAREAVRRMSTENGGRGGAIVNVSSMAARLGSPNEYVDYAACKGAIDTLTIGLSKEVANQGIRVNGLRPGVINTDIHGSAGDPGRADRVAPSIPMQRAGEPQEVAAGLLWLLGDAASYVTGTFIDVAGGR
ncbi:MAG: NAD(P)-dependent dehydrogenase (short-subunit alcohol dehydrogenase family) [Gammaproteobacteria bacterium]|jgi:NAD(P)-dependent dehydrogenase (short-subunit alcohol dehydrogenase family)